MKKYIILSLFVLFSFLINAQNIIKGKIFDSKTNENLVGVNIFALEINNGCISDENGEFILSNLPDGKIKLQFSFVGYNNEVKTFILNNSTEEINISLQQSVVETQEIVVSGGYHSTQHENAVKIDVLKLKNNYQQISPNFTEILTQIAGVSMISKGNSVSKPVIRGLSMNEILILNNGFRIENYQYSENHPMGIDEFGVENVEVIKGPASLLYGSDAMGGVINFIKEKPANEGEVLGNYDAQFFSNSLGISHHLGIKGAAKNIFGNLHLAQKTHSDYLQGGGQFVPNSRFNEYSVKSNVGFTSHSGIFNLFYDFNHQNLGMTVPPAISVIHTRDRKNEIWYQNLSNHLIASQNKLFLGNYKWEINTSYQLALRRLNTTSDIPFVEMNLQTISYETKLHLPSSKTSEYIIGYQGFTQTNENLNQRLSQFLPNAKIFAHSVFSMFQYTFFDKLMIQTGLRGDYNNIYTSDLGKMGNADFHPSVSKNYTNISASLGATFTPVSKIIFRSNFATAFRTPNLAELTSNGMHGSRYELGNENLKPEKAYETDASIHFHGENLTFDIAGFYNSIENYIHIAPLSDSLNRFQFQQTNAFLLGGEAGIHFHPQNFHWLHCKITFSNVIGKKENNEYLPFIPAQKLNFEVRVNKEKLLFFKDIFVKLHSTMVFEQSKVAVGEIKTEGYTLFDANCGFNISRFIISLGVNNIFDKKYVDHLSTLKMINFYNSGRNFTFSVKIPFQLK